MLIDTIMSCIKKKTTSCTERAWAQQKQDENMFLVQSDLKLTMAGVNLP